MRLVPPTPAFAVVLASIFLTACGEGDPAGPTPIPAATATVSGVVKAATGAVIEGASVTIGTASKTTGADGAFEFQNLPVGSATITVSAPKFDTRSESIGLNAGANTRNVVLSIKTMYTYQNVVAYLRPEITEYKAAIVFLPGLRDPITLLDLDSRQLVRGDQPQVCSIWCGGDRDVVRSGAMDLAGGNVALVGASTLIDSQGSYEILLQALTDFGTQSQHPELATIPIFFIGHSMGGCTAYGFTRLYGARVAGFLTMKGGCHNNGPAAAAATVPGHFLIGGADELYRKQNITSAFETGRSVGAPWAISIDAFGHSPIFDFDLMFDWIDDVLAARLPATTGAPLRSVSESAGWLGNRSTGGVATYACYGSSRSSASWLPSQETALDWQRMAGGNVVVSGC
jgi:pimeloyl-ACP methyl ester carboxylesterase